MDGTRKRAGRRAQSDNRPRASVPDAPQRNVVERVLALQRTAGNHATSALLQRSEVTAGTAAAVKFTIGADLSLPLVTRAWARTLGGALDDNGVAALREAALSGDETIDDNERMFIAALLEPGNAKKWHAKGHRGLLSGQKIEFDAASITAANRARVRDFGRGTTPTRVRLKESGDENAHAAALKEDIVDLAGPFATTARDALALADGAKVTHIALYYAMLNGASDSTPGDRAFAGAVYVIARRERLPVAADLMAGRVKVDQVPRSSLPKDAEGMYQPRANASGRKGDTVYLPSDLQFLSLVGQGTVVHELTHVAQDAQANSPAEVPVVEAEFPAFRAEARFLLHAIASRSGPPRDRAVEEIAKNVRLPTLLSMVLEATELLGDDTALTALKDLHAKVLTDGDPKTALELKGADLNSLLQGLSDEDRHYETTQKVEKRTREAIGEDYRRIRPGRDDGFGGESVLDISSGPGSQAPTLQRQPEGAGKALASDEIDFIIGGDVSVAFALRAKKLAKRQITAAAQLELHDLALQADDTVNDAERMFIAALADPANAKNVADAKMKAADVVRLSFARDDATRKRMRDVSDLRRPGLTGDVAAANDEFVGAAMALDLGKATAALAKAERAAERQILKLAGSRARDILAFGHENGITANEILDAMINASSDSTAGDMVAAGAVYAIAKASRHELADHVRSGRLKVDAMKKLDSGVEGFEPRGVYQPAARDLRQKQGSAQSKGDTIYLSSSFDIRNLADRGTVVHELQHAMDDWKAATTGPLERRSTVDLELAGYTAGARYTLEELSRTKDRPTAITDVAEQWDAKRVLAAGLASRTDPRSTPTNWIEVKGGPLVPVVREVYAKVKDKQSIESKMGEFPWVVEQDFQELVRALKGEIISGGAVDPRDQTSLDSLSGESMLDTIGRRPPPRRGP